MKVYELLNNVEIQSEIQFCYYDYFKEKRIEISRSRANDKEIEYMYNERGVIYIEVEMEE